MELVGLTLKEDGTFERSAGPARLPASPLAFQDGVASKDVCLHPPPSSAAAAQPHHLSARIFLPQSHPSFSLLHPSSSPLSTRLPVILYFHGGGFVLLSIADSIYHPFLHRLAKDAQAIVVAVDYRLAPQHRLPAAYDDCLACFTWLQSQAASAAHDADPWLHTFADFSRCYLMGDSAGGNIVYNLSLKLANVQVDPLHIRAHVLIHPFFGGIANTTSEEILMHDDGLPLSLTRWFWDQALPQGADCDHPFINPMSIPSSVYANAHLPKTLVTIAHGDPMKDRQVQYFTTLKDAGVDAHVHFQDGKHAFYLFPSLSEVEAIASFMKNIATFLQE